MVTAFVCLGHAGCDRDPASALQGQRNLATTFFGKVVDEAGAPLSGVALEFELEAYPKDWSFHTRGRPHDKSTIRAVSDADGLFQFEMTGCMLRMIDAGRTGYRLLEELDARDSRRSAYTRAIWLISWGQPQYKSDPHHPTVFVLVADGARRVTALPCQGGYRLIGNRWVKNEPTWPSEPSLDDVDWVDGQARSNVQIPLVFKAVDTAGRPLANVNIAMEVERYRTLEEMRHDGYNRTKRTRAERMTAKTGDDGLARATANGFRFVGIYRAWVEGCGWNKGPFPVREVGPGADYYARPLMDEYGNPIYRCDEANPMVLVMVEADAAESRVMPCRGGYELQDGQWRRVEPTFPLDGRPEIVYRLAPAALPATPEAAP